jgi:hypothetical protein
MPALGNVDKTALRDLVGGFVCYVLAAENYFSRRCAYKPRQSFERGAFSCAVTAEKRCDLSLLDFKADTAERGYFTVMRL